MVNPQNGWSYAAGLPAEATENRPGLCIQNISTNKGWKYIPHRIHGNGIFAYIYYTNQRNVGKYTIHGSYGYTISWIGLWQDIENIAFWRNFDRQSSIEPSWLVAIVFHNQNQLTNEFASWKHTLQTTQCIDSFLNSLYFYDETFDLLFVKFFAQVHPNVNQEQQYTNKNTWATKKPSYSPLYWLFNRDLYIYIMAHYNPYLTG